MKIFILYLSIINILSFIVMFIDKTLARLQKYRIPERFLFSCAILLGALGIYFGMFAFRHKTKHVKFTVGIPLIIILNILTIYYLISHVFIML